MPRPLEVLNFRCKCPSGPKSYAHRLSDMKGQILVNVNLLIIQAIVNSR